MRMHADLIVFAAQLQAWQAAEGRAFAALDRSGTGERATVEPATIESFGKSPAAVATISAAHLIAHADALAAELLVAAESLHVKLAAHGSGVDEFNELIGQAIFELKDSAGVEDQTLDRIVKAVGSLPAD